MIERGMIPFEKDMLRAGQNSFERFLSSLLGRTSLVILTGMLLSAGLMLVYLVEFQGGYTLLTLLVQAALGLICGVTARILLAGCTRTLQLAAALVAMIAGQGVFGAVSRGVVGVQATQNGTIGDPGWDGILQVLGCGTLTVLVTLAWNRRRSLQGTHPKRHSGREPDRQPPIEAGNGSGLERGQNDPLRNLARSNNATGRVPKQNQSNLPAKKTAKWFQLPFNNSLFDRFKDRKKKKKIGLQALKSPRLKMPKITFPDLKGKITWGELKERLRSRFSSPGAWIAAVRSPRTRGKTKQERVRLQRSRLGGGPSQKISLRRTSSKVKLLGEEEHYCPYCLEQVTRSDPRGLKKCPICKTWHHADCWGEVGECQVPHYQT